MTIPHGSRALLMIPDAPVDVFQEYFQAQGSCCCGSHLGLQLLLDNAFFFFSCQNSFKYI